MSPKEISWRVWPLKRSVTRSILVLVFVILVLYSVQSFMGEAFFTAVLGVLFLAQLSAFFLPTHYKLDEDGVEVWRLGTAKKKPWTEFRSFYADSGGVLLSPFPTRSRLEKFRGISLMFAGNRREVIDFVRSRIEEADGSTEDE
jgi:hypothetical protein